MNDLRVAKQFGLSYKNALGIVLLVLSAIYLVLPEFALAAQLDSGLMSKAQSNESVRIMIKLKTSMPDAPASSGPKNKAWRDAISQSQQQLLDSLEGKSDSPSGLSRSGKAKKVKGVKKFRYHPFLAMEADSEILNQLANNPDVIVIQEDVADPPSLAQSIPLTGVNTAWTMGPGYTGAGWNVAILDTGVDKTHSFLSGKVVSEACYSTNSNSNVHTVCPGGVEETTAVGSGVDCSVNNPILSVGKCDHGTHVAGIAAGDSASFSGVAKDANIIAIQVFSRFDSTITCNGSPPCVLSFSSDQILGLERVLELSTTMNIAAANMSLGGGGFTSPCDDDVFRKAAIDNLRAAKIATAIASGNNGYSNRIGRPGCISSAISVGSTTKFESVSSFSNSANFLKLLAPGSSILSSVPPSNGFAFFNGTSMATPHVAGTWALMRQADPNATVTQVLNALQSTGQPILDLRNNLTHPRIQVDAAITALTPSNTVSFDSSSSDHAESAGTVNINVSLSSSLGVSATVDYAVTGGTATGNGIDYTLANGTLTFTPGQTTKPISVQIDEDAINETNETVIVTLSNPSNTALGGTPSHTITIEDNDTPPAVSFSTASSTFQESDGLVNIPVALNTTSALSITVNYAVTGGTATIGTDFTLTSGSLTFNPGEILKTFPLSIIDNSIAQTIADRTVVIALSNPTNATLTTPNPHTATIQDDDLPEISFLSFGSVVQESLQSATMELHLSNPAEYAITAEYAAVGGNATGGGVDYNVPGNTVTFPAGQTTATVPVSIIDDNLEEGFENIAFFLSNIVGAQPGNAIVHFKTIIDDDTLPSVQFNAFISSGPESRYPSHLWVVLSNAYKENVVVSYTVTGGTATGGGTDYFLPSGTLTFFPGDIVKDIPLFPVDDGTGDAGETIEVTLSTPVNATLGSATTHIYTLTEDIVGTNNLFVGDLRQSPPGGDIRQFDGTTGDFLGVFGVTAANVEVPGGVAFHPITSNLYVVDTNNGDIRIFDGITGDLVQVLDQTSDHLSEPVGIGFHPQTNNMFVTDKGNTGSVHVFNSYTGESLGVFGQTRSRLTNPEGGIAFHPITGNLLISDFTLGTVLEFDGTTGAYLGDFCETAVNLGNPFGLNFNPNTNNLFAIDFGGKNVVQFNGATGDHIGVFGQTNSLSNPLAGLEFHPGSGNLFASDTGTNNSILQFDGNSGANLGAFGQTGPNLDLPLYLTFNQQTPGTLRAVHLANWTEQVTSVSLTNFRPASVLLYNSGNTPIVYSITLNQPDLVSLIPMIGLIGPNSFIEAPIYLNLTAAGIDSGNVVRTITFNNLTNGLGNSTETITFVPDGSL